MSNITVTHADSGLLKSEVVRREQISPHFVRVTLGGDDLTRFTWQGFDQWARLAIPVHEGDRFDNLPDTFGYKGYAKYLTLPRGTRPVIRAYTLRDYRAAEGELDIDFLVHGSEGVGGPWAAAAEPGDQVALIDQGCGWRGLVADWSLLIGDDSGLPAIAGILRDMPRDATGHAIIEVADPADQQQTQAPDGVTVQWVTRDPEVTPGATALETLRGLDFPSGTPYAFVVGERGLATGGRRFLVGDRGIAKEQVTFSGYWRIGKSS